jgi:hypothetical protein
VTDALILRDSAPARAPRRHPLRRQAELAGGIVLIAVTPIVALLPGPAGTATFAGGMMLILRNSSAARRRWARIKRRHPRTGDFIDRLMRRGSALRRHARDKASQNAAAAN